MMGFVVAQPILRAIEIVAVAKLPFPYWMIWLEGHGGPQPIGEGLLVICCRCSKRATVPAMRSRGFLRLTR